MSRGTFVGTTNLLTNPSAEGSTTGWSMFAAAGISGTLNDATDFSWVGPHSFKITLSANSAGTNAEWGMQNAPYISASPGKSYSVSCRVRLSDSQTVAYLRIDFFNASNAQVSTQHEAIPPSHPIDQWISHRFSAVAPSSATQVALILVVRQLSASRSGALLWADGLQLENTDNPTPYCDGDQPGCIWNGTPHASTSTRDAIEVPRGTTGKYGVIRIEPELFIATRNNVMQNNISDWMLNGTVQLDTDSDVPMTFNAQILYPDRLHPFQDFLAPWLTVVYADGTFRKEQVGLFVVVPMNKSYTYHDTTGDLDGRDLTWLVAQQSFEKTYKFKKGAKFVDTVRDILDNAGFPRHDIRDSDRKAGRERSWPPGTSKLEIINELLTACSFYNLYADRHGWLKSIPFVKINKAQVAGTYRSGDGSYTIEPFTMTPSLDSLTNYVVVVKEDTDAKPNTVIKAVRKNTNPASPTSIPNIGTIMKVVSDSNIADQKAADDMADKLIDEGSNITVEAQLQTFPEPWHDVHEVYELDLQQRERFWQYWDRGLFIDLATGKRHRGVHLPDGSWANPDYKTPAAQELRGRFLVKGWTLTFSTQEGNMQHTISRIVPYGGQVI